MEVFGVRLVGFNADTPTKLVLALGIVAAEPSLPVLARGAARPGDGPAAWEPR